MRIPDHGGLSGSGAPPSEDAILACIDRHFPRRHPALIQGRGDDCALIRRGAPLHVSSDLFLEDVHFRRSYFSPQETGHKALAVNVSDLAACGARPLAFSLSLGLPPWADMDWLDAFFSGMASLANAVRMALAGGDLARADKLCVSISVFGESPEDCSFLGRAGSRPGDAIFLVGEPGLARVGLARLEDEGRSALERWPRACAAHLRPEPRLEAGLMLARAGNRGRPPALMDLSDGLLRDLPRLLAAGCQENGVPPGAELELPAARLPEEVLRHARLTGRDAVGEALLGGEDYALLGSCAPEMLGALRSAIADLVCIGHVTAGGEISCNGVRLEGEGFDHFAR